MHTSAADRRRVSDARPRSSAPDHERHPLAGVELEVEERQRRVGVETDGEGPQLLETPQRARDAGRHGDGEVLDGTGRDLGHCGRDVGGTVPGKHHTGDAGALGGAQERPHVVGIGDAIEDEEERWHAPPGATQVVELDLFERTGVRQHALRCVGTRRRHQPGTGNGDEPHAPTRGQALDVVDLR